MEPDIPLSRCEHFGCGCVRCSTSFDFNDRIKLWQVSLGNRYCKFLCLKNKPLLFVLVVGFLTMLEDIEKSVRYFIIDNLHSNEVM